ncbi:YhgE/Pip family protein [Neobacillus terrae]|uniref:YhgE/Pip family protein n=1 Tax=Neobacillus terrae TaxID=3034837 RepID=UPI00140B5165|nr:YhgE/Pip domain-containing protein [Neobacillus terrae]NHM31794.1 YhgE/Pip domain-containing protein [Neobacillus terrae]
MNVFSLFWSELAKLAVKKGVLLSVIAALLIPVVYGGILLSPTWSPYDNLSNLPVAVVNNDEGAMSGDEKINVGNDLVADLKKGKDLRWEFVDSDEARSGLDNFKYYMIIEIPKDFSKRVTTVLEPNPKNLELKFTQNEGLNFMAAQVTKSATESIREQLANKITEKYVKNIFANLGDVANGFKTAADGSAQLHDGTVQLHDGTGQMLDSLTEKSADIKKLADGSKELEAGTAEMASSLSSKQSDITKLASGSKELKSGTGLLLSSLNSKSGDITRLAQGSAAANDGTGKLLAALKAGQPGVQQLAAGGKSLAENAPILKAGTSTILAGLTAAQDSIKKKIGPGTLGVSKGASEVAEKSEKLRGGLQGLLQLLEAYKTSNKLESDTDYIQIIGAVNTMINEANNNAPKLVELKTGAALISAAFTENKVPDPKNSLIDGINLMAAGQKNIDDGATLLVASAPALQKGTADLATGWNTMIDQVTLLHGGTTQIADGTKAVQTGWGDMTVGVTKLDIGAAQISAGNASVDKGWHDLSAGAIQIHDGMVQVSDGNASVNKGWGDMTTGVTQLNDGAAKLDDGSNQLASGLKDGAQKTSAIKADDQNIKMFASPVKLAGSTVHKYPHYRDSTAPYVLSLALFVGILVLSLFINFRRPEEVSALSWFGAKFLNLSVLAVGQALLLSLVVLGFLGMNVDNPVAFVLFAVIVSIIFSGIILFFASLGNAGRFIALAFVVLQLSTTGANLPIDMLPENLRNLSSYLPFTYTIEGFKSIISLNDSGAAFGNIAILLGFFVLFMVLSAAVFLLKSKEQPHQADIAV